MKKALAGFSLLLAAMVASSGKLPTAAPMVTLQVGELLGSDAGASFAQVLAPHKFTFPKDHDAHPDFRSEWWYITGNLSGDGHPYGFQVTFFRQSAPPHKSPPKPSAWRTNQLYMAHFTITDIDGQKFYPSERFSRGAVGLAGCKTDAKGYPRVWTENWSYTQLADDRFELEAAADGRHLKLDLKALKPPVLEGHDGLSQKGPKPGEASYYYSMPRLEANGTLQLDGRDLPVTGVAWLDREWSSKSLPADLQGWDWFCLQMDDKTELMYYRLRRPDGSASAQSAGTFVDEKGKGWPLVDGDLKLTPMRWWVSPLDGTRYPVEWKLDLSKPTPRTYTVRARADNQELNLAVRYWEGAVEAVSGASKGVGFLELVGYPKPK